MTTATAIAHANDDNTKPASPARLLLAVLPVALLAVCCGPLEGAGAHSGRAGERAIAREETASDEVGGAPASTNVSPRAVAPLLAVELGGAGSFAILAHTGIATGPASVVTGDLGVSPAPAAAVTGFSLVADASGTFATSPQVAGNIYAADDAAPTTVSLTTAIDDMDAAFTDAAGRSAQVLELCSGNIGGMTLAAGVYRWSDSLSIPNDITLAGSATDVWVLQVAHDLTMASGAHVVLAGGALASNVFWQVGGLVDLGADAHDVGAVLAEGSIALHAGASIDGRLLSHSAVTLDGSTVTSDATAAP